MRRMRVGEIWAEMHDDMTWSCELPLVAEVLNRRTDYELSQLSPADGDPRVFVFNKICDDMEAEQRVDTTIPRALPHLPEGVTY